MKDHNKKTVARLPLKFLLLFFGLMTFLRTDFGFGQSRTEADSLSYELYLTRIQLAEALLLANENGAAKTALEATDPRYCGPEWHYLQAVLDHSYRTLTEHQKAVVSAVFSPDGKWLATGSADQTILLWQKPFQQPYARLQGHKGQATTLDFSPDSRWLASGSSDFTVKIWDLKSQKEVRTITEGLSRGIYQLKFSPDGQRLGVVSWELHPVQRVAGFAKIFDFKTGQELSRFDLDTHPASAIDFSPDGQKLLVAGWGMLVKYFDIASGQSEWTLDLSNLGYYTAIQSADISPDGQWIILGGKDKKIRLVAAKTGAIQYVIEPHLGHKDVVNAVRFSPDGKTFVSGSSDQLLLVWDADSGKLLHTLRGHTGAVAAVAFHPEEKWLASAGKDGTAKIWNLNDTGELHFELCENGPWYAPVSPDQRMLAAACSDSNVGIWNLATGQLEKVLQGPSANCAVFSPDGAMLATAGHDAEVHVWDLASGAEIQKFSGHRKSIFGIAWQANTGLLATASSDKTVRLWDIKAGKADTVLAFTDGSPYSVQFAPHGTLITGCSNGKIKLWSTSTWALLGEFQAGSSLQFLTVDPAGQKLLTADGSGTVYLWDLANLQLVHELRGHTEVVYALAFHPTKPYAVTGSYDRSVKFWDLRNGRNTLTVHGYQDNIFWVNFLANGSKLLVTETEGAVHLIALEQQK